MAKTLLIRDSVHGDMTFEPIIGQAIDSDYFQRLRYITQNGLLYLVYPGLRHSRFEHSLGVSYTAKTWFESLLDSFQNKDKFFPLSKNITSEAGDEICYLETIEIYERIANHKKFHDRCKTILTLAALLHDIGHGPFSHTLEKLKVLSLDDYENKVSNSIKKYIKIRIGEAAGDPEKHIEHEDISVIYLNLIVIHEETNSPLFEFLNEKQNLLIIAGLINKDFKEFLFKENLLDEEEQKIITLFSPMISGLFDVDRIDYLMRDSMMAGVPYGKIEYQRIQNSAIPFLCKKKGFSKFTTSILCKAQNVHLLDHFALNLFAMYTQVYHHKKNEVIQYEITKLVEKIKKVSNKLNCNIDWHIKATDESFLNELREMGGEDTLNEILKRTNSSRISKRLFEQTENMQGYEKIPIKERPVIKDSHDVFLIDGDGKVLDWKKHSIAAKDLKTAAHAPNIFWKHDHLTNLINEITDQSSSSDNRKRSSGIR